jgi:hypothetical protein
MAQLYRSDSDAPFLATKTGRELAASQSWYGPQMGKPIVSGHDSLPVGGHVMSLLADSGSPFRTDSGLFCVGRVRAGIQRNCSARSGPASRRSS